ncbi:alkaline-phosphatase-like protein [Stachybotrys elegans]|uniref:Alkaline-phosphatase-like protein n=1 Tax=Stachybotrys elegans TaxID=80388 RepID=A0A8K0T165_9HYPO|nr:alkaline-phosphatase-like protein [Stachybotrys elegans]
MPPARSANTCVQCRARKALPTTHEQLQMVNDFFRYIYALPGFAFLSEISVTKRCLDETINEALLLSICGLTTSIMKYPKYYPSHASLWVQRAEDLAWQSIESPTVFKTQALLLAVLYRVETGNFKRGFMLLSIVARSISALRLQYERLDLDHVSQEVRRRLTWSIMLVDSYFSVGLPESSVCQSDLIYLKMPCPEEDFHASELTLSSSSLDGVAEGGLLQVYLRLSIVRRDVMRLKRQLSVESNVTPQLTDLAEEMIQSLRLVEPPPYNTETLQRYAGSRWLPRYVAVQIAWHQTHCDIYRLFVSGYQEAAPDAVIRACEPGYVSRAAISCLHHARTLINIIKDVRDLNRQLVAPPRDICIGGYHASRLLLFFGASNAVPQDQNITDEEAIEMAKETLRIIRKTVKELDHIIAMHMAGTPDQRREFSDEEQADRSHRPRFAMNIQRRTRLGIHSALRQAGFRDEDDDSREARRAEPVGALVNPNPSVAAAIHDQQMPLESRQIGLAGSAWGDPGLAAVGDHIHAGFGPLEALDLSTWDLNLWPTWGWQSDFSPAGINSTPNLDRIANEGMLFNHCYVTNSICTPSRAAILCGTHNHVNGVLTLDSALPKRLPNVAKQLRASPQRYQTAMVGKWHLGEGKAHEPAGFDYWSVVPGQGEYWDPQFIEPSGMSKVPGYATDIITDKCIDWMKKRDKSRPFFIMCHHKAPHRSWEYDSKHKDMYTDPVKLPDTFTDDYKNRANAAKIVKMRVAEDLTYTDLGLVQPEGPAAEVGVKLMDVWNRADRKIPAPSDVTRMKLVCKQTGEAFTFSTPEELAEFKFQRYMQRYLRTIQSIDDNVGRLLDYLDEEDLAKDTIVIYTSDQGFFLGEHGWFDKRFMYEESFQMPFLIRYPREIKSNSVCNDIISNVDFAPTFLDFAGVTIPSYMQGFSFRSLLQGTTPENWQQVAYHRYWMHNDKIHGASAHYGIRDKRYKLIYWYNEDFGLEGTQPGGEEKEWELFDCEKDPLELFNCYHEAEYASVVRVMMKKLEDKMAEIGDEPVHHLCPSQKAS